MGWTVGVVIWFAVVGCLVLYAAFEHLREDERTEAVSDWLRAGSAAAVPRSQLAGARSTAPFTISRRG